VIGPSELDPLLTIVCGPAERGHVHSQPDLCAYWTRKEAVLKATGEGLRRPMTDVTVSPPSAAPELIALAGGPPPPCRLADVAAPAGYLAAAAVLTAEPVVFAVIDAVALLADSFTDGKRALS
jgi:4'-phosphopantetheinyl transferase